MLFTGPLKVREGHGSVTASEYYVLCGDGGCWWGGNRRLAWFRCHPPVPGV